MALAWKKERRIYFSSREKKKKRKCKRADGIKTGVQTRGLYLANHQSISLGLKLQPQPRTIIDILTVRMSILGRLYIRFVIRSFTFSGG